MKRRSAKFLSLGLAVTFIAVGVVGFLLLSTLNQQAKTIRVACVGDSLTQSSGYPYELWKLLGASAPYTIGNYSMIPSGNSTANNGTRYAIGNFGAGSTTVLRNTETPYMNTSAFLDALLFHPDVVIIMLGTNDAQPNLEQFNASFVGDYLHLVASFQALEHKPKIWIVLPPPIFSNQSGKLDSVYFSSTIISDTRQVAQEADLATIDIFSILRGYPNYFPDGEHPNSTGAELIAKTVYQAITK